MLRLHKTTKKNIARIAKRCPENTISVVKCVKWPFPKVLFFFYSDSDSDSDSVVSIEKNHAASPQRNHATSQLQNLKKKRVFLLFERAI